MLDFDQQKACSVSLSTLNVYACLICGKFLQGKSSGTQAYMHSLQVKGEKEEENENGERKEQKQHNLFIGVTGEKAGRIFCLPDNYEVKDTSLNDIKFNLNPVFSEKILQILNEE